MAMHEAVNFGDTGSNPVCTAYGSKATVGCVAADCKSVPLGNIGGSIPSASTLISYTFVRCWFLIEFHKFNYVSSILTKGTIGRIIR